jgi:hypothetical protein
MRNLPVMSGIGTCVPFRVFKSECICKIIAARLYFGRRYLDSFALQGHVIL